MNRLTSVIVLTQLLGTVFAVLAFAVTILYSSVIAPGGSLLTVLTAQPVFRVPLSIIGGLFLILVLASLALYTQVKRED